MCFMFFRSNSISVLGNLRSSLLLSFPLLPTVNECPFSLIKQRLSGGRRFGRFSPISIRGKQAGGNPLSSPPRLYYGGRRVRRTPQENRGLDVGGNCSKFFRATQRGREIHSDNIFTWGMLCSTPKTSYMFTCSTTYLVLVTILALTYSLKCIECPEIFLA